MFAKLIQFRGTLAMVLSLVLMPKIAMADTKALHTCRFLSAAGVPLTDEIPINTQVPTFILIHGFRDTGDSAAWLQQADAIQRRHPRANVIVVDWRLTPQTKGDGETGRGRKYPFALGSFCNLYWEYCDSAWISKSVGHDIAHWIKRNGILPRRTVISGHSLGAQIAAYASNACAQPEMCGEPVHAIIAADPAGPGFENRPPEQRLDPTDARHVVVMHTTESLGDENAVGTSDIYLAWPEALRRNDVALHSLARELVIVALKVADTPTMVRTTPNADAFDLDLASRLNFPSESSGAIAQSLHDLECAIATVYLELVSEALANNVLTAIH
jgi:pimeloyl-ACP methyl ester carboxylesterase